MPTAAQVQEFLAVGLRQLKDTDWDDTMTYGDAEALLAEAERILGLAEAASVQGEGRVCRHKGDRGECLAPRCNCPRSDDSLARPNPVRLLAHSKDPADRAVYSYVEALEARADRATSLAERYGEAIVAISAVLPNVNRVRAVIASLDPDPNDEAVGVFQDVVERYDAPSSAQAVREGLTAVAPVLREGRDRRIALAGVVVGLVLGLSQAWWWNNIYLTLACALGGAVLLTTLWAALRAERGAR